MKNKGIALAIIFTIIISTFSGICFIAKADSPNLLELYNCNPSFKTGVLPWETTTKSSIKQISTDSADGDGFCVKITNRNYNYSNACLVEKAYQIFSLQGSGTYCYSFYVKCANKNDTCKLSPTFELYYRGANDSANTGKWLSEPGRQGFTVNGNTWTKLEIEVDVQLSVDSKSLVQAKIYSIQRDFDNNAVDLLFDNFTLIKKGTYNPIIVPDKSEFSNITPVSRTGIGAIYYHMWFQSLDNWWQYDNKYALSNDRNSTQEARSLSPKAYHERMPFFAKLNKSVASSNYIVGDLSAGIVEFPDFSEAIWRQEMEYAIETGIDFMAYLWSEKGRYNASAFNHHINTKGLNGRIQMCAILQHINQDLEGMAKAMCEPYWYTIDGMPVVYIFGGSSAASDELISKIRYSLAKAQYEKFGKVGKPAYIIVMGVNSYSAAVGNASRGLDATGWYAFSTTSGSVKNVKTAAGKNIKQYTYSSLTSNAISTMKSVSKVATDGYMGVSPLITLGWDTSPRVDNPVSWTGTPENSKVAARPTATEITQATLDVLNWNKENKNVFKCNTVLFYAWNEYTEGGWICPTAEVDANGNIVKNPDGTTKVNRTHLDAVKAAIKSYRQANNEVFNVTVDVGKDEPTTTPTPTVNTDFVGDEEQTTVTPTPTQLPDNSDITEPTALATAEPTPTAKPNILDNIFDGLFGNDDKDNKQPDNTDEIAGEEIKEQQKDKNNFSLIFLVPVILSIVVTCVVVIVLKKKKADKAVTEE